MAVPGNESSSTLRFRLLLAAFCTVEGLLGPFTVLRHASAPTHACFSLEVDIVLLSLLPLPVLLTVPGGAVCNNR